jgi:hypothetical protein
MCRICNKYHESTLKCDIIHYEAPKEKVLIKYCNEKNWRKKLEDN